ncbi:LysR family transcriptional regulator [Planctomycetes bacterium CA13]|uniref:LysR family transcriptional regulator n=1 Tax=Novipirellula herctigrandis TaxID=2527986 RepID=UPI0011B3860D
MLERVNGLKVSANTIERICMEVGDELASAAEHDWQGILDGEAVLPQVAVVSCDGGRIRTRKANCGPGIHLECTGWNETKNAIFVSASSDTSSSDPQPRPPSCFLNRNHVAGLTETAKTKENAGRDSPLLGSQKSPPKQPGKRRQPKHKPKKIHRTLISSMRNSRVFGVQMDREARRRKFDQASRRVFVADGLSCNWTIHAEHFRGDVAILDFTHAVSYLHRGSIACFGQGVEAWENYKRWMILTWQGKVAEVIEERLVHQSRLGEAPADAGEDDPRAQLRQIIGYLKNNLDRMHYARYRCEGLPTTSAWMESAVKEINYRTKGTEMFWNHPAGAEAILQIRAASLSDDDRLARFLARRPGSARIRKANQIATIAA